MPIEETVALLFLAYMVVPVAIYLLYILVGWLRRRLRKGGGSPAASDSD